MPHSAFQQLCKKIMSHVEEFPIALLSLEEDLIEEFSQLCDDKNVHDTFAIDAKEKFPVALVASLTPTMWDKFVLCGGQFPSSPVLLHAMWNKRFHLWSGIDLQCRFVEAMDNMEAGSLTIAAPLKSLKNQKEKNHNSFCGFVTLCLKERSSTLETLQMLINRPSVTGVEPILEHLIKNNLLDVGQTKEFLKTHKDRLYSNILKNYLTQHALNKTLAPALKKKSHPPSKKM